MVNIDQRRHDGYKRRGLSYTMPVLSSVSPNCSEWASVINTDDGGSGVEELSARKGAVLWSNSSGLFRVFGVSRTRHDKWLNRWSRGSSALLGLRSGSMMGSWA